MENKQEFKKWIMLILIAIIGYWIINNFSTLGNILNNIFNIIFPFVLGGGLAFLINIPMSFFEKKLSQTKGKKGKKRNKTIVRAISLTLSLVVVICIILLIVYLILPELINIVKMLIDNIPYYASEINKLLGDYTNTTELMSNFNVDAENIKNEIMNEIPNLLNSSISIVTGIIGTISKVIIAIIFAMYILVSKEKLQKQTEKLLYAYIKKEKADKIIEIGRITKDTFTNFFTVQCLEATILGVLCIIGMLILQIPYAVSIGILIGVTALIPVLGAFIGIIVGAILILSVAPMKVITFIIFVLILQQVEGNLIYPKVVGDSVGLPGMWVLVAVTLGGSLFGIVGMLLGVPTASVLYTILRTDVNKRLDSKESI